MRMGMHTVRPLALSAIMFTVLLTGGVLSPRAATAATYYVATTGNDANSGTQAQPFRTIAKGLTVLRTGDTLYLRGGTYAENIDNNNQTIPSGTSWSNAVTLAAYPGETVTLQPGGGGNVLNLAMSHSAQYIIFDGLILDAVNTYGGINMQGSNTHHIRLQNGEVKNAHGLGSACSLGPPEVCPGGQGISGGYGAAYIEFINLKVHDNGLNRLDHGFYIAIPHALIDGCDIYNNSGYGIQVYESACSTYDCANNTTIRNSRIHDNRGDGGVTLNHGSNILFYNNLVYNNLYGGITSICYGSPSNTQIYNNTFYGNGRAAIDICTGVTNTQIKANIIFNNSGTINDNGAGTVATNNLTTNPQFVNAAANDFRLQATSSAIDAGVAISVVTTDYSGISRPQGCCYDIGAYEYQGIQLALPAPRNLKAVTP